MSSSCDLLSFSYLCATKNNTFLQQLDEEVVVICFHFLIFVPQRTTITTLTMIWEMLWFAFIFLSLCHKEQLLHFLPRSWSGCDLLSFSYLCATKNNPMLLPRLLHLLWFAFIFLSLCHKEQPVRLSHSTNIVVICFHFLIFVPQRTTAEKRIMAEIWLWFAFIFLSLCHKEQPS